MAANANFFSPTQAATGCVLQAPWFGDLPEPMRSLVLETAFERTVKVGECIAHAGEPSLHWFGVVHGLLHFSMSDIDGNETTLHCVRESEWGGEGSLLKREARRYDVVAVAPSRVCFIPADTFHTLHREVVSFNHFLLTNLNERMAVVVGLLAAERLCSPELRVAKCLLMLVERRAPSSLPIPIQQIDLGHICGLSRQRTNMALSSLKQVGLIHMDRFGLRILDEAALQQYVHSAG